MKLSVENRGRSSNRDLPVAGSDRYRCGTLVYTKAGLFILFAWLLWGDFCFTFMETIWPNILPLMLKSEGAPNLVLSVVMTTIPSAMNFVLNPIVSTASDRYRSKLGRRIPFLIFSTPFVVPLLILLGFSQRIGGWLHEVLVEFFPAIPQAAVTIGTICALMVAFRLFDLFVATIFWYLFKDVVPPNFLGRFVAFFRIVGSLAGALFNFFIYRYAESHAPTIFLCAALLYGTAFTLLCLNVKEGQYPPPEPITERKATLIVYFKTFFRESFNHRIFCLVFLCSAFMAISNAVNVYQVFLAFSIGLNLDQFGKVIGIAAFVGALIMYPMGSLADRFHPIRVMLVAKIAFCAVTTFKLIFLFYDFAPTTAFWIYACTAAIAIPINAANLAASVPMLMRLFPQERFGQFCSANNMCAALGTMLGGLLAGLCLDLLKSAFSTQDYCYRLVPLWSVIFMGLSFFLMFLVFREWKKLGGDTNYTPPIGDRFQNISAT